MNWIEILKVVIVYIIVYLFNKCYHDAQDRKYVGIDYGMPTEETLIHNTLPKHFENKVMIFTFLLGIVTLFYSNVTSIMMITFFSTFAYLAYEDYKHFSMYSISVDILMISSVIQMYANVKSDITQHSVILSYIIILTLWVIICNIIETIGLMEQLKSTESCSGNGENIIDKKINNKEIFSALIEYASITAIMIYGACVIYKLVLNQPMGLNLIGYILAIMLYSLIRWISMRYDDSFTGMGDILGLIAMTIPIGIKGLSICLISATITSMLLTIILWIIDIKLNKNTMKQLLTDSMTYFIIWTKRIKSGILNITDKNKFLEYTKIFEEDLERRKLLYQKKIQLYPHLFIGFCIAYTLIQKEVI